MDRHHFSERDFTFFEAFLSNFENVQRQGETKALCRCSDPLGLHHNGDRNSSLSADLVQNGKGPTILLHCHSQGCEADKILAAKGLNLKDLYPKKDLKDEQGRLPLPGCTVAEYAAYKRLPESFLTSDTVGLEDGSYWCPVAKEEVPAVEIPYFDRDGDEIDESLSWRTGLQKTEPDTRMRRKPKKKGGQLSLYGLHCLEDAEEKGYCFLVE